MSARTRTGTLRLFSAAITDQIMLSAANFAVGLVLIRFARTYDYSLYVLIQSALLLLTSAQSSWIAGPLAAVVPKKGPTEGRGMIGAITTSQKRVLRRLAPVLLLLVAVGFLARQYDALLAEVLFCAVAAGWAALRREHLRNVLLIYSKPGQMLRADAVYVVVLLAGVLSGTLVTRTPIIWVTITLAIAAWAGAVPAQGSLAKDPGWANGDSAAAWRELRVLGFWSLFGSVMYWLFGQSYSYLLATRLDLKAVADVNEARLLLMPAVVLSTGMKGLLGPTAAKWNAEVGFRRLVRRLLVILGIVGCLDLLYFLFIWIFRGWLVGGLLHKQIMDRDQLLVLWTAITVIGLMRDVLQCALTALGKFHLTATQTALSAIVALAVMWFGIGWWGAPGVLIGQIVGEVVNVAGIIVLMRRHDRLTPET